MGFHIVNIKNGKLQFDYVESYEELSFVEFITKDSIIYQGEEHWKPHKISDSEKYKYFSEGWYRAGIQAQELFKQQATNHGFILEELNQDQKSFKSYTLNANNISIKRGDFLIRNYGNIEIDVKCRGFRKIKDKIYFDFKVDDVNKHLNMQKFTNTPILIAVYENKKNRPVEESIYFFAIDDLFNSTVINKYMRIGIGECYQIPLSFAKEGFGLIEEVFETHFSKEKETYTFKEKGSFYKRTHKEWTINDDEKLELLFGNGYSIKELSNEFERKNGEIRSRINKLELTEKYDRL